MKYLRSLFKNPKFNRYTVYNFSILSEYRNPAMQIVFSNLSLASRKRQFSSRSPSNLFCLSRIISDKRSRLFCLYSFKESGYPHFFSGSKNVYILQKSEKGINVSSEMLKV